MLIPCIVYILELFLGLMVRNWFNPRYLQSSLKNSVAFLEKLFLMNYVYSLYLLAKWFESFMMHFSNLNLCSYVVTKKKIWRDCRSCRRKCRNKEKWSTSLSLVLWITGLHWGLWDCWLGGFGSYFFSLVTGFEEWQVKPKDGPNEWDGFQLWQVRAVHK